MRKIALLLSDVDGTLVTNDKVLTEGAQAAAREMRRAGIRLAVTSGRPPKGMRMLIEPLHLDGMIAGFNGGVYVHPDLSVVETRLLNPEAARSALQIILDDGLDAWVYTELDWLVRDPNGSHVAREAWTVK
ncbi:MAG: HAD hydrolase family protein, partial [Acetobacteraceae bacterium]|nr:HAD hydrolase family protein [Acetobacteraceae bacterium]